MMVRIGRGVRGGNAYSRINLVKKSFFSDAGWTKTNATTTATTDSDGGSNAFSIEVSASAATNVITGAAAAPVITATGPHVFSVIGKIGSGATDGNKLALVRVTGSVIICSITINWTTGAIGGSTIPSGTTATDIGSGWWLISVPFGSLTAGERINVYAGYTGSAETAGERSIWYGPMLETGTTMPAPTARIINT